MVDPKVTVQEVIEQIDAYIPQVNKFIEKNQNAFAYHEKLAWTIYTSRRIIEECKAALEAKLETNSEPVAWIEETKYGTGFRFDERLLQAYPNFPNPTSVDALKEELRVTEQNLADCMARLHAYDCKIEALIADIESLPVDRIVIKEIDGFMRPCDVVRREDITALLDNTYR